MLRIWCFLPILPIAASQSALRVYGEALKTRLQQCLTEADEAPGSLLQMASAVRCISWLLFSVAPGAAAIEVYTGESWLTAGLVEGVAAARDSVASATGATPLLASFEGQRGSIELLLRRSLPLPVSWLPVAPVATLSRRLRALGSKAQLLSLEGSAYPSELCPAGCHKTSMGFEKISACFRCPQPKRNESALRELCAHLHDLGKKLELAIIDTGGPGVEEWYVLETYCRPRSVFLVNAVFGLHEGWIGARLQRAGWREVLQGSLRWGYDWPHMLSLLEETGWSYLVDSVDSGDTLD